MITAEGHYRLTSGEAAAHEHLEAFLNQGLPCYGMRNDPNAGAASDLSPYLHFGQISAQHIAMKALAQPFPSSEFLEELIVRRELSDNYCFYNRHYDTLEGFPDWAKKTHKAHEADERPYQYALTSFQGAETHDPLWNAAQTQLVLTGRMHGYMRMYWAKKILEWTPSADEAMQVAIVLNDTYALDGRDPNGYTGIGWSIGSVHDRAWGERAIFGKIRYMSYEGCKRKFDVKAYCDRWLQAGGRL